MALTTTVKSIQDVMRKDAGVDGDAQRIGQLGWMLFFKIFSDLEEQTELMQDGYISPVPPHLRWEAWADEGLVGKDAPTGDALLDLINTELFSTFKELDLAPLRGLPRQRAALLRSVFDDAINYMKNGTLLRQVINKLNQDIDFNESTTRHLFGDIYEQILKDLQGAGNAGEFYTPRAATQFAVDMINPQRNESVLDPACGTGGFLTCAYEHVKAQIETADELAELKDNIRGIEKKALPHLLAVTNMMIHGIEVPTNIRHDNTLSRPLRDYGPKDQVDVVITNPPFGGMEEDGIENNFPTEFRTRETADLFLVLVMELLKDNGRAAIVLPDGTLFGEGMKTRLKQRLVEECNLHTIVRFPNGVFAPYTSIKTNILFFDKNGPTEEIWYYEHPYPDGFKSYSKTKPMRIEEFEPEKAWWTDRQETEQAWRVPIEDIIASGYNLDIDNPNTPEHIHEDPDVLLNRYHEAVKAVEQAQTALRDSLAESLTRP
ncbi:type I restriction-modification system subunit M [Ilumatobacter sp.]|nr:type I restriction-modification system subunit M [Ilumatobacter sp.]